VVDHVRPRGAGCLNVKFLQDLDRERDVFGVEQRNRSVSLGRLSGIAADQIEQDIGIEKVCITFGRTACGMELSSLEFLMRIVSSPIVGFSDRTEAFASVHERLRISGFGARNGSLICHFSLQAPLFSLFPLFPLLCVLAQADPRAAPILVDELDG
jgi:hypothetical protein